MIETDEQRRWWFATHPEYSRSRRGTKNRRRKAEENEPEKVRPEEVDAYVDNALQYVSGPVAELLKSTKRNFGTQAEDNNNEPRHSGHKTANQTTNDKHRDVRSRRYSNIEPRRTENPTPIQGEVVSDPITFLDLFPHRRIITAPIQAVKGLLRSLARQSVLSATKKKRTPWKVGDDHLSPTSKGKAPTWSTQRRRYWRNEAEKEGAEKKWGAENVERMKKGLAPQRENPHTGKMESKDCHHEPIPQREGGKVFTDLWPDEHAEKDPHRRLKK